MAESPPPRPPPPPVCYVCTEPTPPLYKICKCNALLHKECFQELVNKVPSHATHCAVCKHPYSLNTRTWWYLECHPRACAVFTYCVTAFGLSVVILWLCIRSVVPPAFFMLGLGALGMSTLLLLYIWTRYRLETHRCCCLWVDVRVQQTVVLTDTP